MSPSDSAQTSSRKRRREQQEIKIVDLEKISDVFKPQSEEVLRETEEAERDKAKFQAIEAKGKTAQSLLSAIAQARSMLDSSRDESERAVMDKTVKNLMKDLSDSMM